MKSPESALITDLEEARVAAEAERPVRDLAREEGVDEDTKAVFDKRAEQRGENALSQFRSEKESRQGLLNPELDQLKKDLKDLEEDYLKKFGDEKSGNSPRIVQYSRDEGGNLKKLAINGLLTKEDGKEVGSGILGKKLEEEAIQYWKGGRERDRENLDSYLMDVYRSDPEIKKMIDSMIDNYESRVSNHKKQEEIKAEKGLLYETTEGINSFLEKIGLNNRIPESIRLEDEIESVKGLGHTRDDKDKIIEHIKSANSVFQALKGIEIKEDQLEDALPDLEVIESELSRLFSLLERAYGWLKLPSGSDTFGSLLNPTALKFEKTGRIYDLIKN